MALHAQVLDAFCPEAALVPVGFINIDALRLVYLPERREIFRRLVALPGLTSVRMLASLVPMGPEMDGQWLMIGLQVGFSIGVSKKVQIADLDEADQTISEDLDMPPNGIASPLARRRVPGLMHRCASELADALAGGGGDDFGCRRLRRCDAMPGAGGPWHQRRRRGSHHKVEHGSRPVLRCPGVPGEGERNRTVWSDRKVAFSGPGAAGCTRPQLPAFTHCGGD